MNSKSSLYTTILFLTLTAHSGQTQSHPVPGFTLNISERRGGDYGVGSRPVEVTETNTSTVDRRQEGCLELRGWYTIAVRHNGVNLTGTETLKQLYKRRSEHRPSGGALTVGELVPPGGTFQYTLPVGYFFDLSESGIYEVTVSKESEPRNPSKGVRVNSNTITLVVPPAK